MFVRQVSSMWSHYIKEAWERIDALHRLSVMIQNWSMDRMDWHYRIGARSDWTHDARCTLIRRRSEAYWSPWADPHCTVNGMELTGSSRASVNIWCHARVSCWVNHIYEILVQGVEGGWGEYAVLIPCSRVSYCFMSNITPYFFCIIRSCILCYLYVQGANWKQWSDERK